MEPHSDEKGSLKGKFEDFSYTPKEEVWDRVVAGPGERPLGAMFWTFAWMPKAHVWRRLSTQLHPMPYLRIASWSAAAAAAVALLAWLQFGSAGEGQDAGNAFADQGKHLGKGLATMEWEGCWGERPQLTHVNTTGFNNNLADHDAAHNARTNDLAGGNRQPAQGPQGIVKDGRAPFHPPRAGAEGKQTPVGGNDRLSGPLATAILRDPIDLAANFQEINRRTTWIELLDAEREKAAQAERDKAMQDWIDQQDKSEPAALMAQAGASISSSGTQTGNADVFQSLQDYVDFTPDALSAQSESANTASEENFHTPVVIAAAVEHRLVGGFGLGGGLVYTRMRSYQDAALGYVTQHLDITRQYLGLAANALYNQPLSKRSDRLALFGSAGLQYDFGLAKHTSLMTYELGNLIKRQDTDPKLGGQASVNVGLGMRYAVYKNISLYAQGTAARYFYASEPNLYTGHIAWPSMQVGLRVRL